MKINKLEVLTASSTLSLPRDRGRTNGLTRKEVNDISRVYGEEFGSKAFGKTGGPLQVPMRRPLKQTVQGLKT
jgi:hypothetical protein